MMIQVFLSALLAGIALLVGFQGTTSRVLKAAILAVVAFGAFLVWTPETTDGFAEAFGVGRGADLLLYVWVVITLALIVFLYLKLATLSRRISLLTRAIALSRPRGEQRPPDGSDR